MDGKATICLSSDRKGVLEVTGLWPRARVWEPTGLDHRDLGDLRAERQGGEGGVGGLEMKHK